MARYLRHDVAGFRTWSAEIYAAPHSTVKVHQGLIPGPANEVAEAVAEADATAEASEPDAADEYEN